MKAAARRKGEGSGIREEGLPHEADWSRETEADSIEDPPGIALIRVRDCLGQERARWNSTGFKGVTKEKSSGGNRLYRVNYHDRATHKGIMSVFTISALEAAIAYAKRDAEARAHEEDPRMAGRQVSGNPEAPLLFKSKTNATGYVGVAQLKSGRYNAVAWQPEDASKKSSAGNKINLGTYDTAIEAATAYAKHMADVYGEREDYPRRWRSAPRNYRADAGEDDDDDDDDDDEVMELQGAVAQDDSEDDLEEDGEELRRVFGKELKLRRVYEGYELHLSYKNKTGYKGVHPKYPRGNPKAEPRYQALYYNETNITLGVV